jgi:ABC-type branched-subunit amino acid transport system ATPase component
VDAVAAVEVGNLQQTYGHVIAVDDLSFTIDHGEEFALLGPNGAGKSTVVRSRVFGYLWSFSLHALAHTATRRSAERRR